MKRGLMIGVGVVGVVVVAVIAVVVYGYLSRDSLIRAAVEKYGSEITQVKVDLAEVKTDPASGEGLLGGFVVGNPKGFNAPSAFNLGGVKVRLDIATLTSDTIHINEVTVTRPEVTYELASGGSNVDAIQKNVDAYMKKMGVGQGPAAKDEGPGKKLVIDRLSVSGGVVNVAATVLKDRKMSAPLPTIELKDIGKEKGGASAGEVASSVMTALNASVGKAMGSIGVGKTLESLQGALAGAAGSAKEAVSGATGSAKDALSGATGSAKGTVEDAAGKVKGLLGR